MANRATLTFNSTDLPCLSARVRFKTASDHKGDPAMGSFKTQIRCWMDVHNNQSIKNSQIMSLFNDSNVVTTDKIRDAKIVFWADDACTNALCSYSFKGWIEKFQIVNPLKVSNGAPQSGGINYMMIVDLVVALNQQNAPSLSMGN